jgi:hypothetical protein
MISGKVHLDHSITAFGDKNDPIPNGTSVCRMCRAPGSLETPLFCPCKCTGSVRHVHQECLLEWLKHSKKQYCELCNHKFYLPSTAKSTDVLNFLTLDGKKSTIGKIKQVLIEGVQMTLRGFRNAILGFLWFIFLPILTGLIFDLYFNNLSGLAIPDTNSNLWTALSSFQHGLIIWFLTIIGLLGLMLLREYLVINIASLNDHIGISKRNRGNQLVSKKQARDVAVNSGVATLDSSGDQPTMDALSPTHLNSKPSVLTDGIRPASIISRRRVEVGNKSTPNTEVNSTTGSPIDDGRWITQINNKEYRTFLKRRELLRRKEKLNNNFEPTEWEDQYENELIPFDPLDNNCSVKDFELESIKSLKSAKSAAESSNRLSSSHNPRSLNTGGKGKKFLKFDPNIRCKICESSFCIDREHVIQASQLNNSPINENSQVSNMIPRPKHDLFNFAIFIEPDYQTALFSILELIGFTQNSTIKGSLWNFGIAILSNLILLHTFVYVPFLLGKLFLDGYVLDWSSHICKFFFESAIHNILSYVAKFQTASDFLVASRFIFTKLSLISDCSNLTVTLVGNIINYRLLLTLTRFLEKHIERNDAIFFAFEWFSFSKALITFTLQCVVEFILFPAACFCIFLSNLGLITKDPLNIFTITRLFVNSPYISLGGFCLGGQILLNILNYAIKMIRSQLRPGLFFILGDSVNGNLRYTVRNLLEGTFMFNSVRNISSLIIFFLGFELTFLGAFQILSRSLSFQIDPFNFLKRDQAIYFLFNSIVLYLSINVLLTISKSFLSGIVKSLRMRSFVFGGRYISDVKPGRDGTAVWTFLPDQDDRQYNNWMRIWKMSQVPVEPVDVAKLSVAREVDHSKYNRSASFGSNGELAEKESAEIGAYSRFRGYNVVYCPRFWFTRVMALLAISILFLNAGIILLAKCPTFIGEAIQNHLMPSIKLNGTQIKLASFGAFEIGNLGLFGLLAIFAGLITHKNRLLKWTATLVKKGIALILFSVLAATCGLWIVSLLSPMLYPGDSIPKLSLFFIFEVGFLATGLLSIIGSIYDHSFSDSIQQLFSTKLQFSLLSFVVNIFGPVFAPIALSLVLPPVSVLFLAPAMNLSFSSVVMAQKSSFSHFLLFPLGWYAIRFIFSKHSAMVNLIRDEAFINTLKQRPSRSLNLSIEC